MTATTPAHTDVDWLQNRVRDNVRLLKVIRKLTDERIADLGNYSSRQIVADRLSGRTPIDLRDVVRLASALDVDASVLMGTAGELMMWVDEHATEPEPARPALAPTARKRASARKK